MACQTAIAMVSPPSGRSRSVAGSSFITSTNTSSAAVSEARPQQRHVHAREHVEAVGAQAAGGLVELARHPQEARLDRAPGEGEEANEIRVEESDHRAREK